MIENFISSILKGHKEIGSPITYIESEWLPVKEKQEHEFGTITMRDLNITSYTQDQCIELAKQRAKRNQSIIDKILAI